MLSHWFSWWRDVFLAMLTCAVATKKLYHPYFDLLTAIGFLTTLAAATCWHPTAKSIYAWYVFQNPWVLHCKAHVLVCLGQVRSLVCGGVYWAAPPCSTWIWLSRSTTGRSLTRPRGPWVSTVGTPFVWDMFSSPLLIALSSSFTLEGSFKELYQNSRITIPEPSSSCWGKQSFLFGFWNLDISNPEGSRIWKKVRRANRLIRRLLYMQLTCIQENRSIWYPLVFRFIGLCVLRCEYLFQKKVHYVIENPVSSLVWSYRPMEALDAFDCFLMKSEKPQKSISTMTLNLKPLFCGHCRSDRKCWSGTTRSLSLFHLGRMEGHQSFLSKKYGMRWQFACR